MKLLSNTYSGKLARERLASKVRKIADVINSIILVVLGVAFCWLFIVLYLIAFN